MRQQQRQLSVPRAHSIIALGLSRKTRRFLQKLQIRTIDALAAADVEWLLRNGADGDVLADIERHCASLGVDKVENGEKNSDSNNSEITLSARSCGDSRSAAENRGSLIDQNVDGEADYRIGSPQKKAPLHFRFAHTTVNDIISDLINDKGEEALDSCGVEIVADLLLRSENENLAVHSSDESVLEAIADEVFSRYNEMVTVQSAIKYLYDMPIANLRLSTRANNVIKRSGRRTVGDLCALGEDGLLNLRCAGVGVVADVKAALDAVDPHLVSAFETGDLNQPCNGNARDLSVRDINECSVIPSIRDAQFDTSKLSTRARNVLWRNELLSLGAVLEQGKDGLKRLRNAGVKTVDEIWASAQKQAASFGVQYSGGNECESRKEYGCDDADTGEQNNESGQNVGNDDSFAVRAFLLDFSTCAAISPSAVIRLIEDGATIEDAKSCLIESLVLYVLERNPWGLTQSECLTAVANYDVNIQGGDISEVLCELESSDLVSSKNEVYCLNGLSIEDAVANHVKNDTWRLMLLERLSGKTLEEIGEANHVSRERVRQITAKAMTADILEGTRAGRFLEILKHYDLNERELRFGLGATLDECEAALQVKKTFFKGDSGVLPAPELLENKALPSRVRLALDREIHHGYVKIDGDYVAERRLDLMLYALRRYGSKESLADEEFIFLYKTMLDSLGIADNPELQPSERYMSNFRLQKCVLSGYGQRVRYYDFDKYDVQRLIRRLGFEDFENKEISTKIFLKTKAELLKEFEIDDAYELHSLLRSCSREAEKDGRELPYNMTRRMPIIRVGEADRRSQVLEFAQELSPISVDDFAMAYEEEYGVEQASFKGGYLKYISDKIVNGVISMNLEPFTAEEKARMSELLPDDFYRLSRVESIYKREFPNAGTSRLNAFSLKGIGFKTYASCVLRDVWASQSDYFESFVFASEFLDERSVPEDVAVSHSYETYIDDLIRERRLLPYEGSTWITEKGLSELEITDVQLIRFADEAALFCEERGYRYCTMSLLRDAGFDQELFSFELSDDFYISLMCTEGTRFSALTCSRKKIACLDGARTAVAAFLEAQVKDGESIAVEDLILRIEEDFGVSVRRDKIIAAPNRSDLYYNPITDMIYKNRETFIKEIE